MPNRTVVQGIVAVAAFVWAIGLTLQGVNVEWTWLRWYSLAVAIVIILLVGFDRWMWRWWPFKLLVRHPDISGTWKGEFRSTWDGEGKTETAPTREAFLVVRQTFSSVAVTLLTEESRSRSVVASLSAPRDSDASLSYTYMNTPKLRHQDRSRIHHGTAFFDIHGPPVDCLDGCYWTDRDTKGDFEFRERVRALHSDFVKAKQAFL